MIAAKMALLLLLAQVPATDPAELVAQLGSARYAQREAAASALERLGRTALPALRGARDVKDPEVRSRASALISRIEGSLLTQPSLVTLDFRDRPLAEIVKSFNDQTGIKMALFPDPMPALQEKRVTLQESAPLPFWKALDRLCEAAQLQYNFGGMHGLPNSREPVFPLFAGGARPAGPMSDRGPFRANLVGLHYQRDVSFVPTAPLGLVIPNRLRVPPPPVPAGTPLRSGHAINEQFYAQIQVAAEPRLSLSQSGPLKLLEAVDDRGQSLIESGSSAPMTQRTSGYFGLTTGSTLHIQARLRHPNQPGRAIKRLRGVVPVTVSTRKPDPLTVMLSGATGKTFHHEGTLLTVQDLRTNPNTNQITLDVSIKSASGAEPVLPGPGIVNRAETQQQIEVVDAQGKIIPWYHSTDAEGSRMTLTLTPHDQGPPAELRYYSMVRASTEVSFDFEDVPLP